MTINAAGAPEARFNALAADLEFAVVAEGIGAGGERVSRGCMENPSASRRHADRHDSAR